jgi:hypothetical protein
MKRTAITILSALLAGCTAVPALDQNNPTSLAELSALIECEALAAFRAVPISKLDKNKWLLTYTITSEAEESASLGASPLNWVLPANVTSLILNAGASLSRSATRTGVVEYSLPMNDKTPDKCVSSSPSILAVSPRDFKLREWVDQIFGSSTKPNLFSYSVDVIVTVNANIGTAVVDKDFSGSFGVTGQRKVLRTVDFAFAAAPSDAPLRVFVTNFPQTAGAPNVRPQTLRMAPPAIPPAALELNRFQLQQLRINRLKDNRR